MATHRKRVKTEPARLEEPGERCRQAEQALDRTQCLDVLGRAYIGVAHDLNNLLGVISNSAHLLAQKVADPSAQAAIAASLRAVDRASRLTGQLLELANVNTQAPCGPIDLATVLAAMQDLMAAMLGRRIDMQLQVAAGTFAVAAARDAFELALLELLLNARDAMPRGGRLWIDVRNADAADLLASGASPAASMVLLSVGDDGTGMADDQVRRAFEPYMTTRAAAGGRGVGLSRVKAFCNAVGGHASLACTEGLGTSVTLLLPAVVEQALPMPVARPLGRPAAAPADSAQDICAGVRLLLVEDNKELASVTAALLATYGIQVQLAHNAELALTVVAGQADIDLVLSDIVMPGGIDGVELAHRIRRLRPGLPVVLITAYSTALEQAGDFTVLRKPCSAACLIGALRQQLQAGAQG